MKRLLELLAANYPDVPMPYILDRFQFNLPYDVCAKAVWLRFPLPLRSSDICVTYASTLPGMAETFCVCAPWEHFWTFDSEDRAVEAMKAWIYSPRLLSEIQPDKWTRAQ